jgi:uncharacterized protein
MPATPADKVDVEALAAEGATLDRRYPLDRFSRLADMLVTADGEVVARFHFLHAAEDIPACELSVEAVANLRCERCLESFRQPIASEARIAFVSEGTREDHVPEGFEAVTVDTDRLSLSGLVEEELLLSLPVVALHAEGTPCARRSAQDKDDVQAAGEPETHRPFAGLKELLKH